LPSHFLFILFWIGDGKGSDAKRSSHFNDDEISEPDKGAEIENADDGDHDDFVDGWNGKCAWQDCWCKGVEGQQAEWNEHGAPWAIVFFDEMCNHHFACDVGKKPSCYFLEKNGCDGQIPK
jgi:hypothetical protein